MSKVLSGGRWLSDCPGSQSIASGLNPSMDVSKAMLFCCSLYYGKKHTKMEAQAAACTEGKRERNRCCFEWCFKDWELGGSSLGSDLNRDGRSNITVTERAL